MPNDELLRPGDIEPHDDIARTLRVVKAAYDWTVDVEGRVCGLVAGDMGYESTHIVINLGELRDALWLKDAMHTPTYEQGVAAGLEMAAKVAEDRVAGIYRSDSNYHKGALGEAEYMASAIRALADQHNPSPAEEPMP